MDYFSTPLMFRIRKALRYVRLYGFQQTYVKIVGQRHMRRTFTKAPPHYKSASPGSHVGIIGCGNFAFTVIAHFLSRHYGQVIRGCMDANVDRASSLGQYYNASYCTSDAAKIIADPAIDLIFIASNHASHADYAKIALAAGKDVHIEKPHVVRADQLTALCDAMKDSKGRVLSIGYNRTRSTIGKSIQDALWREQGELMQSWFVAGHELPPDHWYLGEGEGGRVLGNLAHWVEFVYQMMPPERRYPITINPTRSAKADCDIAVTYTFGDGSIAVLTFSAKGHAFEGVKERYAAHRGDVLISMDDFHSLTIDRGEQRKALKQRRRNKGHEDSVRSSYEQSRDSNSPGCSRQYVWEMGQLILETKRALELSHSVTVLSADETMDVPQALSA